MIAPKRDPQPPTRAAQAGRVRTENLNRSAVASAPDIRTVPTRARELASSLAGLFERDGQLAERLNDAQTRLEIHWTIHRAFLDHRDAYEQRRQLAVDVGELSQQLADTLTAAGWTEQQAHTANVNHLADGRPDNDTR
jgi:hypothetical protein